MDGKEKLRTQKQAAEYAGVDTRTIRRWEKDWKLRKDGDHYDHDELDECKACSRRRRGLYDADILGIRTDVKGIVADLAAIRSRVTAELLDVEERLVKAVEQKR